MIIIDFDFDFKPRELHLNNSRSTVRVINGQNNIEYEQLLTEWLSLLTSDYDQLIFCLYALGYTQDEIGQMVNRTQQAIQLKIKIYRKIYREELKRCG